MSTPSGPLCPARLHRITVTRRPCSSCETERLHEELVERISTVHPVLSVGCVADCIDAITGSGRGLASLLQQFAEYQGEGRVHWTAGFLRLLWSLHDNGANAITLPLCDGCGATPKSMRQVDSESLCSTCDADRHRRPCTRCGVVAKVGGVDDDRRALCRTCHTIFIKEHRSVACASCGVTTVPRRVLGLTLCHPCEALVRRDPARAGACSRCGHHAHLIARSGAMALCRSCTQAYVTCAIADLEPEIPKERIEVVLAAILTHRSMLGELAEHFLSDPDTLTAPDPSMPAIIFRVRGALCDTGALRVRRWACIACQGNSTRRVRELCLTCHLLARAEVCARCAQRRPLARRGPDGESFCGPCAPHVTALFETCARCSTSALPVSRSQGAPLCGRCTRACYEPPSRPCVRCRNDRAIAANWPDGAVCYYCYRTARTEWAWCGACGEWRITPGRDKDGHQLCTQCSGLGLSLDLVCPSCGKENGRWTATQCPRCWVHGALEGVLFDASGQVASALVALHETLTDAMTPNVAQKWLEGPSAVVVARMARGETPISHDTLDDLRLSDGRDRHRTLRALLVISGVLQERNEAIAGVAAAIDGDLARLGTSDVEKAALRHYAHFELLRLLRRTQERHGGGRGRGTAAGKWRAAVAFVSWLSERGLTLSDCHQADLDGFLVTKEGAVLAQRVGVFVNWARPRGHVRSLRVSTDHPEPRYDQLTQTQLARVATELMGREDWDLAPRVVGLLVIMFGLTLRGITALRCSDLERTATGTELSIRGFSTTLPAPVGDLALRLSDRSMRPGCASERWLFPGALANQPVSLSGMTKHLTRIGFPTMLARNAARRRLVGMLDPDVMRRITDISAKTATDLHTYYAQPSLDRMGLRPDTE